MKQPGLRGSGVLAGIVGAATMLLLDWVIERHLDPSDVIQAVIVGMAVGFAVSSIRSRS